MADKTETKVIPLPRGRMINGSLFEKDKFDEKSTASYKIEMAFPKADKTLDPIFEELLAYADAKWGALPGASGELNVDGGELISGVLDGDELARKREAKGKQGDAYKGMWVIRANTIFNLHGVDGPGGIQVWDEEVKPIGPANQHAIYPGCYVQAAVTIYDYQAEDKLKGKSYNALKFYLSAVQKVADGEKLVSAKDTSTLFKPVGRTAAGVAGAPAGGRRARAG